MTEGFIRHLISFVATLICFLVFLAGYKSAQVGWWWSGFGVLIVYAAVYQIIEK